MINQPQTILRKKAGSIVSKEFLETALRKCPSVSGFVVRDTDDGKTTLEVDHFDKAITVENLMTLQEQAKPYEAVFYLANMVGKFDKTDIQPFTIEVKAEGDEVGRNILSFFVEGDFPKYSKPESGHTDEYNFVHDIVIPKLEEMFEDSDQDIGKFTAKLHKTSFEKDLSAHVGHRAVFLFLPLEGEPIMFGDSKGLAGEYDWGSTSQNHGFGTAPKVPITTQIAAAAKKFNPFGGVQPAPSPAPIQTDDNGVHHIEPKPAAPHPDAAPKKESDVALPSPRTDTAILHGVSPPPKLDQSARNMWLRLFNGGELPKDHHKKDIKVMVAPDLLPLAQRDIGTKAEVKTLEADVKKFKSGKPVDMVKPVASGSILPNSQRPPADFIPSFSDKEMTEATSILAGFIDRDKVPSPLEIQKIEAQWPTFSQKMGIPFEDLFRWTVADFMALCAGNKTAVMVILELRRKLIEKGGIKLEDLVNTSKVKDIPPTQSKTVEQPKPAVASKRSSVFGLAKAG